jgi:Flp pilus assembly protein TadG
MLKPWRDRARRDERGVALVEFALALPLLVLICLGTIDFGRAYATWNSVKNAAREGAAFAQLYPGKLTNAAGVCADPNNVVWHVHNESSTVNSYAVSVTKADGSPTGVTGCNTGSVPASGTTIKVKASTTFSIITPFIKGVLGGDPTVSASVAVRVQ